MNQSIPHTFRYNGVHVIAHLTKSRKEERDLFHIVVQITSVSYIGPHEVRHPSVMFGQSVRHRKYPVQAYGMKWRVVLQRNSSRRQLKIPGRAEAPCLEDGIITLSRANHAPLMLLCPH